MLQNAYFLAKIGADTAENEQHFAEICQKLATTLRVPTTPPASFSSGWSRKCCAASAVGAAVVGAVGVGVGRSPSNLEAGSIRSPVGVEL